MGEISGVPEEVRLAFSQRRQEIVAHQLERGTDGWRAAQVAALATRTSKQPVDLAALRADWHDRAAALGFGPREIAHVIGQSAWRAPRQGELRGIAAGLMGPSGLTEKQATFSDPELIRAWAAALTQGAPVESVERLARDFRRLAGVVDVELSATPGLPSRYTTRELRRHEEQALQHVRDGRRRTDAPTVPLAAVANALCDQPTALSDEQQRMVFHVCSTPDRAVCVVGHAGAGKTTALRAVREAHDLAGTSIIGCAPSAIAAQKLEDETGIQSTTIHRLLADLGRYGELPEGCVVVLDEASMAETRVLAPLLEHVANAWGKLVLVGDPAQLPAVGAGGLFRAIADETGAVELTENRRQPDAAEQDALRSLRDGRRHEYLAWARLRTPGSMCSRGETTRGAGLSPTGGRRRTSTGPPGRS
jgi:ATP-dependent exoDNAse (exonuclease V) alpha subunit